VNSIVRMTGTEIAKHEVPDDHIEDSNKSVDAVAQGARPHLLPILPIFLGILVCGLNIFAMVWLWNFVYQSKWLLLTSVKLPTTIFLSLIALSFSIGVFLIVYAIVLRRTERNVQASQIPPRSTPNQQTAHVPTYVRWILVPALIALPAPALTVWASQMVEPIAPKPCIELYQEALNISKEAPNFRMPWTDRDQLRCNINSVLPK